MARYYWLKLHDNFFDKYEIKKLRKIPGGDTYTIIYLKLLLYIMNTEGKIPFEGLETHIHKEIALKINEDETSVEMTLNALKMMKLLEEREGDVAFPEHEKVTGAIAPKPSRKSLPENIKNKYGKFENVKLSDKEIEDLKEFFGSEAIMWQKVDDMSLYLKSKGDKYKSHSATLMTWGRKDGFGGKKPKTKKEEFAEDRWL